MTYAPPSESIDYCGAGSAVRGNDDGNSEQDYDDIPKRARSAACLGNLKQAASTGGTFGRGRMFFTLDIH